MFEKMLKSLSTFSFQQLSQQTISRTRQVIEVLAIITSISGLSLSNLRQNSPIIFYIGIVSLTLLSFLIFLTWKRANHFTDKNEIDDMWQEILAGSTKSVLIFAGDVSWVTRDENNIKILTKNGVNVSVLCRRPRGNLLLQGHISRLIHAGTKVKYYDESSAPAVRGLVIDSDDQNICTALTVSKSAKAKVERLYGIPGSEKIYDYKAIRYVPPQDVEQISLLTQLFQRIWEEAMQGFVVQPLDLSEEEVIKLLSNIPQYSNLRTRDIKIDVIDIQSTYAACKIVKEYKMKNSLAILDAFKSQGIQSFVPVSCLSHCKNTILIPPILEQHDNKLVVVDGMHRLYCQSVIQQDANAICLVISPDIPLPSIPIPFSEVKLLPRKLPRQQSFNDFKPQFFRNIDLLDHILVRAYDDSLGK